jgi:O-antigen/teichoic acid export membrane protein
VAPFLLGRLGQHDYGLWIVGLQILTYLMLLDFGIVAVLPREVAYSTGRAEPEALARVVGETARVVLYQMPIVALAATALWFLMPPAWQPWRGPIGLTLAVFVALFPLRIFSAVLQGLQDLVYLGTVNIAAWALGISVAVLLVFHGFGLYGLALNWTVTQTVIAAACAYRVRKHFPEALPSRLPPMNSITLWKYLGRGFWVSLTNSAQPLLTGSDTLIVGKLLGAATVVPYNSTGKLITVLGNQPQLLMFSAIPGLSELRTSATKTHIYHTITALTLAVLLLTGGLACVTITVNEGFVVWWLGRAQYMGLLLTVLFSICLVLRQWNLAVQCCTFCFGEERRITLTVFADGLFTCAVSIALIWLFGPVGGPVGSLCGVCLISLPLNLVSLIRVAEVSPAQLIKPLWPWFWRFTLLVTAATLLAKLFPSRTILETGTRGATAVLLYTALMWPVAFRSPLAGYLAALRSGLQRRVLNSPFGRLVPR